MPWYNNTELKAHNVLSKYNVQSVGKWSTGQLRCYIMTTGHWGHNGWGRNVVLTFVI